MWDEQAASDNKRADAKLFDRTGCHKSAPYIVICATRKRS